MRKSIRYGHKESLFCRDVANSMRFWRACDVCRDKVTDSLMGEQFKDYLSSIKLFLEKMRFEANCNCSLDKRQPELLKCNPKTYNKPVVPTSPKQVPLKEPIESYVFHLYLFQKKEKVMAQ